MTAWCAHMIPRYCAKETHALDANADLKLLLHIMRRMSQAHTMSTLSALLVLCMLAVKSAPGVLWLEHHAAQPTRTDSCSVDTAHLVLGSIDVLHSFSATDFSLCMMEKLRRRFSC